eukprot:11270602-Alexandrium_andersonii.AAC.1
MSALLLRTLSSRRCFQIFLERLASPATQASRLCVRRRRICAESLLRPCCALACARAKRGRATVNSFKL